MRALTIRSSGKISEVGGPGSMRGRADRYPWQALAPSPALAASPLTGRRQDPRWPRPSVLDPFAFPARLASRRHPLGRTSEVRHAMPNGPHPCLVRAVRLLTGSPERGDRRARKQDERSHALITRLPAISPSTRGGVTAFPAEHATALRSTVRAPAKRASSPSPTQPDPPRRPSSSAPADDLTQQPGPSGRKHLVRFLRDRSVAGNTPTPRSPTVSAAKPSSTAIYRLSNWSTCWPGSTRPWIQRMHATRVSRTRSRCWRSRTPSTPTTGRSAVVLLHTRDSDENGQTSPLGERQLLPGAARRGYSH